MLGVYPSALHVRWRRPDGRTVGALAVDAEPVVFWDGHDAAERIQEWRIAVGWRDEHGSVSPTGGNGSSGRTVAEDVLAPLGVASSDTYFTDCLPYYFTKSGPGSQGARIAEVYQPFAAEWGLAASVLPSRPSPAALVRRTLAEEADSLRRQIGEASADRIVTLGSEAADVLSALAGCEPTVLHADDAYGTPRSIRIDGRAAEWLPLTHPGNHHRHWKDRHTAWMAAQR